MKRSWCPCAIIYAGFSDCLVISDPDLNLSWECLIRTSGSEITIISNTHSPVKLCIFPGLSRSHPCLGKRHCMNSLRILINIISWILMFMKINCKYLLNESDLYLLRPWSGGGWTTSTNSCHTADLQLGCQKIGIRYLWIIRWY